MGGMSAVIPIKNDAAANEAALQKVRDDKKREVLNGHDGTWVAHPGLVPVAQEVFDTFMKGSNQIDKVLESHSFTAHDLLTPPVGSITEQGLRTNIHVGILYIESWLRGNGAAALHNLMEDAATAEISRTQVWQWLRSGSKLADGRMIDIELYNQFLESELINIQHYVGAKNYATGRFAEAVELFNALVLREELEEFLTLPAYQLVS
jgi:malate synthase